MKICKTGFLTLVFFISICTDIVPASPKGGRAGKKVRNKNLPSNNIVQKIENIRKFPLDRRSYKGLKLRNNLKVLLVSDPLIEKSTVCLGINVGSLNDFIGVPGLASFVGHLLLQADDQKSERYTFREFVESCGGTLYLPKTGINEQKLFFEIKHRHLLESLERFADIILRSRLLDDVFKESVLEEPLNATFQEYTLRRSEVVNRILEVEKSLSNKKSMYNHFFYGIPGAKYVNGMLTGYSIQHETLYKHAQTFFKTWYSSNLMSLVVIQKEKNFEELEEVISSSFGRIENKEREQQVYEFPKHHPWGPEQLKQIVHIVLEDSTQSLRLMFPAPCDIEHYKTIPAIYVSHFVAYNGKGSLRSTLRKENLCIGLRLEFVSAGGIGFIKIMCDITDDGMNYGLYFIIHLIFQYIHMLSDDYDKEEWIISEITKIHEVQFMNYDNNNLIPFEYAQTLSTALQIFPFEDVLTYEYIPKQWNPKHINELIDCLKAEKMNIILVSKQPLVEKEIDTYLTEKYFGTKYSVDKISDYWIQIWNRRDYKTHKLEPPRRNEFVPEEFGVFPLSEEEPRDPFIIRKSSSKSEIWFKQDDEFKVPKMWIDLEINSSTANLSPFNYLLWRIFLELLDSLLKEEYFYFTNKVFLKWHLTMTDNNGLHVHMYGYNDKLPILLEKVLSKAVNYGNDLNDDDIEKFINLQTAHLKSLREILRGEQDDHADWLMNHLLNERDWPVNSLLQAAHSLKFNDLKKFANQIFRRIFIRGLIHGNCTNAKAEEIVSIIEEKFQSSDGMLPQELILQRRSVKMADGSHFIYQAMNERIDILNEYSSFFQLQTISTESFNVKSLLLTEIISRHCVPYVIDDDHKEPPLVEFTSVTNTNGILGFFFKVQSKKRNPYYIDRKVERFLNTVIRKNIFNINNEELESFKMAVEMKQYEKPSELMVLSKAYWNEIMKRQYNFNRYETELRVLHDLTIEDVKEFFQETFSASFPYWRRKLAIYVFPEDTENDGQPINNLTTGATLVDDPFTFKTSSSLLALDYRLVQ